MVNLSPCLPGSLACAIGAAGDSRPSLRMKPSETGTDEAARAQVDSDLLRRVARRDREAFTALYDRFSHPLYATALRILGDAREAEDVTQEVFLALWEKAPQFRRERGSAFSWAVTLTRNRAIDRVRMRRRRAELLAAQAPDDLGYPDEGRADDSAAALWGKEKAAAVRAAVAALPPDQQRALELAFFGGRTQQEIAEQLAAPLGTIKARIRRGLLRLRDQLAQQP